MMHQDSISSFVKCDFGEGLDTLTGWRAGANVGAEGREGRDVGVEGRSRGGDGSCWEGRGRGVCVAELASVLLVP